MIIAALLVVALGLVVLAPKLGAGPQEPETERAEKNGELGAVGDVLGTVAASGPRESYHSERPLEDEAACVLEESGERGDCIVARSGYLDLLGRVWGCVLQGEGWVEIVLVSEASSGEGSDVAAWRMSAGDLRGLAGG